MGVISFISLPSSDVFAIGTEVSDVVSDAVRESVAVGAGVSVASLVSVQLALGLSVRTVVLVDDRLPVLVPDGLAEEEYVVRAQDVGVGVKDGETIAATTAVAVPVRVAVWDTVADAS